jgi:signal transduction histidine kinase
VDRLSPDLGQRIRLDLPPEGQARGDWDAAMLDRVITNLLSNALKYSPQESPVEVMLETESDQVHLLVQDSGIGLDQEDLAWLFRRYGRGRGAMGRGIEGLGLGLYLSHGIVEAHGGRLWAESAGLGNGATMHARLPYSVPPPPGEEGPPSISPCLP